LLLWKSSLQGRI